MRFSELEVEVVNKKIDIIDSLIKLYEEKIVLTDLEKEQCKSKLQEFRKQKEILLLISEYWKCMYDEEFRPELKLSPEMVMEQEPAI